jgi:hypothetical protein
MLGWIAALLLAPTQVTATPPLAASDWWERVTVTLTGDGKPQACIYETSGQAKPSADCSVVGSGAKGVASKAVGGQGGQVTRITFERRFHSGITLPAPGALHPGDTLLGREVMKLAIDAGGKVSDCKIVSTGGEMTPDYGCAEASTERFEANAHPSAPTTREGFMTITIYGHNEQVA